MNLIMFEDLVPHLHSLLYEHTSLIHILGIIRPTNKSLDFTQVYLKLLWYSKNEYINLIPMCNFEVLEWCTSMFTSFTIFMKFGDLPKGGGG